VQLGKGNDIDKHPSGEFFELSHKANEKIPFIAECLEPKEDKNFRYRLTTDKHLKVGDVIAIDKPFCKMVQIDSGFQHCGNCLKQNNLDLMPCPSYKSIMFCSEACKDKAFDSFHGYDCHHIDGLMLLKDYLWFSLAMKFQATSL
jgi:hypothetical protein